MCVLVQVKGKEFGVRRLTWHWGVVVISAFLTVATAISGFRYIISDSVYYHAFADI